MMPQTTALLKAFNQQRAQVRRTAMCVLLCWHMHEEPWALIRPGKTLVRKEPLVLGFLKLPP